MAYRGLCRSIVQRSLLLIPPSGASPPEFIMPVRGMWLPSDPPYRPPPQLILPPLVTYPTPKVKLFSLLFHFSSPPYPFLLGFRRKIWGRSARLRSWSLFSYNIKLINWCSRLHCYLNSRKGQNNNKSH